MGTNKITPSVAKWLNDASITKQDAHDAFGPDANVHDLTQAEMDASSSVVTVDGSSTQNGALRWVDPGGSNDATRTLEAYHTGLSRTVGIPKKHMAWASLPATGDIGEMVYVTDLQITVEFRDATADAVLSGTGLAGWHPVNGGLMLAQNATGGDIEANRVVALVGTTATRRAAKTTLMKQQNVLGVNLHSATIATGSNFIVVLPGYGNPVIVRVDPTVATGDIAAGDWLCTTSATAGVARSVGASQTSGIPAASQAIFGVPSGAFAVSLEDRASGAGAGVVMAKMLPAVGTGARAFRDLSLIYSDLAGFSTANIESCRSSTGDATQNATDDVFISAKHLPVLAVQVDVAITGTMSAGGSIIGVVFGPTAGIEHAVAAWSGNGNLGTIGGRATVLVPTRDAASTTVIGTRFGAEVIATNVSVNTTSFYQTGYVF